MTPLRAQMIRDMQLQRLAPRPQAAYLAAVAGLAKCYGCSPDPLRPDQSRADWHHVLVERHRAWRSCHQAACGRKFFSGTTLGWEALPLHLPPRMGRRLLPQLMRVEARQRLLTSAANPRKRAWRMTTAAAGLRVGEVVRLRLRDIASDRRLLRVKQGKGRQARYTLLAARLLTALRTSWHLYRPARWLFTGHDRPQPRSLATAQKLSYRAKRGAGITHGKGSHTFRPGFATHLLAAGVDLHPSQLLLGHRTIDTPPRSLHSTRRHLATVHSPFDLRGVADGLPRGATA